MSEGIEELLADGREVSPWTEGDGERSGRNRSSDRWEENSAGKTAAGGQRNGK